MSVLEIIAEKPMLKYMTERKLPIIISEVNKKIKKPARGQAD
jgi:hypothetical protein